MIRHTCFAYNPTQNCCEALIIRDCDDCAFFKTKNDNEIGKLICELRIRKTYGMSSKKFLDSRRTNND